MLKELHEENQAPATEDVQEEAAATPQTGKAGKEKSLAPPSDPESPEVVEEVVIEEVSIDGMCGVY